VACYARSAGKSAGPWPGSPAQRGKWPARPAATCALAGGSAAASRWQGVAIDLEGGTGEVPGKEERTGAHRNGVPTVRRCKRCRAAAFNGGGVAPVVVDERGEVMQLEGDPGVWRRWSIEEWSSSEGTHQRGGRRTAVTCGRSPARGRGSGGGKPARRMLGRWGRMHGARAWMDETNDARGEKFSRPAGGGSILTGSGGEAARRGGHRVEAERERERGRGRGP
jgi:hypothetical protein